MLEQRNKATWMKIATSRLNEKQQNTLWKVLKNEMIENMIVQKTPWVKTGLGTGVNTTGRLHLSRLQNKTKSPLPHHTHIPKCIHTVHIHLVLRSYRLLSKL